MKELSQLYSLIEFRMLESREKRNKSSDHVSEAYQDGKAKAYKTVLTLIRKRFPKAKP